jgi:hypothetical protein
LEKQRVLVRATLATARTPRNCAQLFYVNPARASFQRINDFFSKQKSQSASGSRAKVKDGKINSAATSQRRTMQLPNERATKR